MGLQDFDARSVQPQQPSGMGSHPCGMFDFQIGNTYLQPSENNKHLMLHIEFTSPAGRHMERFIVDGESAKAIEIANKQISAICHATNVFRLTYPKHPDGTPIFDQAARELRGARGRMEIGFQKGHEPTAEKPEGGYVEIKKYYDVAGNEPGKSGAAPQPAQAAQQPAPMQQQPPMTAQQGGWGQPAQAAPQSNAAPTQSGWQPGPSPAANPPWGK
jgi:hypothetical protein